MSCPVKYLFLGWKYADNTGASKRIVAERCRGSHFEPRSHIITFQSFEDVKTQREFCDQLTEQKGV